MSVAFGKVSVVVELRRQHGARGTSHAAEPTRSMRGLCQRAWLLLVLLVGLLTWHIRPQHGRVVVDTHPSRDHTIPAGVGSSPGAAGSPGAAAISRQGNKSVSTAFPAIVPGSVSGATLCKVHARAPDESENHSAHDDHQCTHSTAVVVCCRTSTLQPCCCSCCASHSSSSWLRWFVRTVWVAADSLG